MIIKTVSSINHAPYHASRLIRSTDSINNISFAPTDYEQNAMNPHPIVSSQMFHSGCRDSLREEGRFPVYSLGMATLENDFWEENGGGSVLAAAERNTASLRGRSYAMMLHSIRAAVIYRKTAKTLRSVPTGRAWASLAPRGAKKMLVQAMPSVAVTLI